MFNVHIQSMPIPLSGTGKKTGEGRRGAPALAGTREYKQFDLGR